MTYAPVTLLHCADLHLDAVLGDSVRESASDDLTAEERVLLRDAPLLSLDQIGHQAIENDVDCVIIAGDVFDHRDVASKDQRVRSRLTAFFNRLNECGIDVVIALGNHDPLKSIQKLGKAWPNNVHIFSSSAPETILLERERQSIALHGVSYATNEEVRDLSSLFPARIEGVINVGVLHTNVGGDDQHKNYAPSTTESLTAHHYDYFALGHIHKQKTLSESPLVAYSGNSQGLSSKPSEREPKGCVLVSIDSPGGSVTTKFIETDVVRYLSCSLHADEFLEEDDIVTFAVQEITNACDDPDIFYLVRTTIDIFGMYDADEMCAAINDSRTNFFVTSLRMTNSFRSFEELISREPFFESIQSELSSVGTPTLEELYGNRVGKIAAYLEEDQADIDIRDEAAQVIMSAASNIEKSGAGL